ncbi:hypothetical protein [Microbulbifer sp.]
MKTKSQVKAGPELEVQPKRPSDPQTRQKERRYENQIPGKGWSAAGCSR